MTILRFFITLGADYVTTLCVCFLGRIGLAWLIGDCDRRPE